jgi:hypothetical protein
MAQSVEVGVHIGSIPVAWYQDRWESMFPVFGVGYGDTYIPQTVAVSIDVPVGQRWVIRGSGGYGCIRSNRLLDQPGKTYHYTDQQGIEQEIIYTEYREDIRSKVSGFFVNAALIYPLFLNSSRSFSVYPGIGIGFHTYQYSGDWDVTVEDGSGGDPPKNQVSGKFDKATLSGLCQQYILGMSFRVSERFSLFVEFSKLGFSWMKQKRHIDETVYEETSAGNYEETARITVAEQKSDYHAKGGLNDLGFVFGMKIAL